jgi:hypothetical protein
MREPQFYKLEGHEVVEADSALDWGLWFSAHKDDRIVRQENVGSWWVSTVFIGLDMRFMSKGPPIVFETMVFDHSGRQETLEDEFGRDGWQERCATWEQALEMHQRGVEWARQQP